MENRMEMRFTGSGGQGVILISVIIAEAAVIAGKKVVQSQSYGPEARGGLCKAETIISDDKIWYGKVTVPDFLLALNQGSLDKYAPDLSENAIVIVDDTLKVPECLSGKRVIAAPIISTARDKVGKLMTANIVAVGVINASLHLFDEASLKKSVKMHIPAGTEELNYKALAEGYALVNAEA